MTTTDSSLESLHRHLDNEPNDWDARRVLADWYEEQGDASRARFQRFLADKRKCPDPSWGMLHWDWYAAPSTSRTAWLPEAVLNTNKREIYYQTFASRQAAENCLYALLDKQPWLYELVVWG